MKIIWTAVPASPSKEFPNRNFSIAVAFRPTVDPNTPNTAELDAELNAITEVLTNWPRTFKTAITSLGAVDRPGAVFDLSIGATRLPARLGPVHADEDAWSRLVWNREPQTGGPVTAFLASNPAQVLPRLPTSYVAETMHVLTNGVFAESAMDWVRERTNRVDDGEARGPDGRPVLPAMQANTELERRLGMLRWNARAGAVSVPEDDAVIGGTLGLRTTVSSVMTAEQTAIGIRNSYRLAANPATTLQPAVMQMINASAGRLANDDEGNSIFGYWLDLVLFHNRIPCVDPGIRAARDRQKSSLPEANRNLDVFERLAAFHNYPRLLRHLGLAFDVAIDLNQIPAGEQSITVEQKFSVPLVTTMSMLTVIDHSDGKVHPVSREKNPGKKWIRNGCLNLGEAGNPFQLAASDFDGNGLKLHRAVSTYAEQEGMIICTGTRWPFAIQDGNSFAKSLGATTTLERFLTEKTSGTAEQKKKALDGLVRDLERYGQIGAPVLTIDPNRTWRTARFTFETPLDLSYNTPNGKAVSLASGAITARPILSGQKLVGLRWQILDDVAFFDDERLTLPAPRSTGISLTWLNRAARVTEARQNAQKMEVDRLVYAESLVSGFVPDIWIPDSRAPEGGVWLPLTKRIETIIDDPRLSDEAEGVVRLSSARTLDYKNHPTTPEVADPHISEVVFCWDGWTFGVERPFPPDITRLDLPDVGRLCVLLKQSNTGPARYVWQNLPGRLRQAINEATASFDSLVEPLARALTDLVRGKLIYEQAIFSGVILSRESKAFLFLLNAGRKLSVYATAWLNRYLIEDALGDLIVRQRNRSAAMLPDRQAAEMPESAEGRWSLRTFLEATPSSVAELRFFNGGGGKVGRYKFRVRLADIAGNVTQLPPASSWPDSLETAYLRYEPIAAPEILLDRHPAELGGIGRGLMRMVIRVGNSEDKRWIVPPRVAEQTAELHGKLDKDDLSSIGSFDAIALTDTGDFPMVSSADAKGRNPLAPRKGPASDCYPIFLDPADHPDAVPSIPYYPDPLATHLAWRLEYLVVADGAPALSVTTPPELIEFYSEENWPRAAPIPLVLLRSSRNTPHGEWSELDETLYIYLPPGMSARLHLSCCVGGEDKFDDCVNTFAVAREMMRNVVGRNADVGQPPSPADATTRNATIRSVRDNVISADEQASFTRQMRATGFAKAVGTGQVSLFSVTRTIDLMHAVIVPRVAASIDGVRRPRAPEDLLHPAQPDLDSPSITFDFEVRVEAQSSGKIRIAGSWNVPVPDRTAPLGFARQKGDDRIGEMQLEDWLAGFGLSRLPVQRYKHTLPNCSYRVVRYRAIETSRYVAQFPERKDQAGFEIASGGYNVPLLNRSKPPALIFSHFRPVFQWKNEETNETGVRKFRRTRNTLVSLYFGGSVGVTGEGEMIGLVSGAHAITNPADRLRFSTCWGRDPIREYVKTPEGPTDPLLEGYCRFGPGQIYNLPFVVETLTKSDPPDEIRKVTQRLSRRTVELMSKYVDENYSDLLYALAADFDQMLRDDTVEIDSLLRKLFYDRAILFNQLLGENCTLRVFEVGTGVDGFPVRAVIHPYQPVFDPKLKLWRCDVELSNIALEYAFVRFAITRFQPHSIEGCEFSEITPIDFVQIAPNRAVSVWRDASDRNGLTLRVQVNGGDSVASGPVSIEVAVMKQGDDRAWIPDEQIESTVDPRPFAEGVLYSAAFKWPTRLGPPRYLFVREQGPTASSSGEIHYPYVEVLDL